LGRIIRHLKAELFGLIRLLSGERPDKSRIIATFVPLERLCSGERPAARERMTKAVLEPAISAGKPKKLLDQMRDVRKHARDVVEALVARAYLSGSVLDTSTATGHLIPIWVESGTNRRKQRNRRNLGFSVFLCSLRYLL
jgi:hypothetical protein